MLNEKIRSLRLSGRMTQVQLAKALGVSKQCVSNWENDNIQPSVEMLIRIARYFNVSTDFLLDFESGNVVSVDGLTEEEIAHVKLIIRDLAERGK
ncbi:MAG TPA: helix-turn-helix domain-containing protein [Firmicutes bacterium]|nr:helix-turn-helix domain-containing protein [Bacillota bacterium]